MLASRWRPYASSIFSKMSQLAKTHQAVNLAQGFPDFDGPVEIKEAAIAAIHSGYNQYAPSIGLSELRQVLAERQAEVYQLNYDPQTEITVFSGATEALFCSILALCEPGDEIISFEPFFDCYPAAAMVAGASFKTVRLQEPGWSFRPEDLEAQISPRTRLLLLNTPHNPSGKVFNRTELAAIAELAIKHNILVLTDEVYEELVFSPLQHCAIASLPGMRERTISVSSTAKTFSMTGWKVGFAFAPAELSALIRIPHQYTVFCSAAPLQRGMVAAFRLPKDYFTRFRAAYLERRDFLVNMLREHGFRCQAPEGTYFVTADYSQLCDRPDLEFAEWLCAQVGVACLPTSMFYQNATQAAQEQRLVRFAFCKDMSTLEKAAVELQVRLPIALANLLAKG